jgi:uncharacterized protein
MNETALITGGASGIGLSFVKLFASKGYDLVIVDIDEKKLIQVKGEVVARWNIKVLNIVLDLSKDGAAQELFDILLEQGININILINNAGFGDFGRFIDIDYHRERDLAGVNMITPMHLMHLFGNDMVHRGKGRILNISSIAAWTAGPYMPMYYATKAFIFSISQSMSRELQGTGVSVTCLCPGPTKTDFERNAMMVKSKMFRSNMLKASTPDLVAAEGYKALMKGKVMHIPTFHFKLVKFMNRFSSEALKSTISMYINTGKVR